MFDNLRSILRNRSGNDYKPEHNGKRKRQKDAGTGTAVDLTVAAHGRLATMSVYD